MHSSKIIRTFASVKQTTTSIAMTYKEASKKAANLRSAIKKSIADAMKKQKVKCISFFANGNTSDFDFGKVYGLAVNPFTDEIKVQEVLAVAEMNGDVVFLLNNGQVPDKALNILEEITFFTEETYFTLAAEEYFSNEFTSLEDVALDSDETLLEMFSLVENALSVTLHGEVLSHDIVID